MSVPYAPTWRRPSALGQLSNTRGANTGADALSMQLRYGSPSGATDPVAGMRVTAQRVQARGGVQINEAVASAYALSGGSRLTTSVLPETLAGALVVSYGGRVYSLGGRTASGAADNKVFSAPILGGNVGSWRYEGILPGSLSTIRSFHAGGVVGGYLIIAGGDLGSNVTVLSDVWTAPINVDGTVGIWTQQASLPTIRHYAAFCTTGSADGSYLILAGGAVASGAPVAINSVVFGQCTGGVISAWTGSANPLNTGVYGGSAIYDATLTTPTIVVAGGVTTVPAVTTVVQQSPVVAGNPTGWVASAASLPAARCFGSLTFINVRGSAALWDNLIYAGGSSTAGPFGTPTSTIYGAAVSMASVVAAFALAGIGLATAVDSASGILTTETQFGGPVPDWVFLAVIGGAISAAASTTAVQAAIFGAIPGTPSGAFASGPGVALAAADLSTGGVKTVNPDGTIDLTFLWGSFGGSWSAGLADGDQVQISVYLISQLTGDASPIATTVIAIGQPPTISGAAPSGGIATGQPTATFAFINGAGGGPEKSWRLQVTDPNGVLVFDSGLRQDQTNSVLVNLGPLLLNGVPYTFTFTVTSIDSVVAGSSASGTATTTVTPAYTVPPMPTLLTATPDLANGLITLTWVNPIGTVSNRIYYRISQTSPLFLLVGANQLSGGAGPQTYKVMDQLALNTAYDFFVTAFSGSGLESGLPLVSGDSEVGTAVQTVFADPFANIHAWAVDAGVPTVAANIVTLPANAQMRTGNPDLGDNTQTLRFIFATSSNLWLIDHASTTGGLAGTSGAYAFVDGTSLIVGHLNAGTATTIAGVAAALVNATAYWLRIAASASTYTVTVYNDSAGAIGSQIATTNGSVADPIASSGQMALRNTGAASITVGGAFASVCVQTSALPATLSLVNGTADLGAAAWSSLQANTGKRSLSLFNLTAVAQSVGISSQTQQGSSKSIPVLPSTSYTVFGAVRVSGVTPGAGIGAGFQIVEYTAAGGLVLDHGIITPFQTGTSGWVLVSASFTTGAGTGYVDLRPALFNAAGQAWFDTWGLAQTSAYQVTINPATQNWDGMLHIAGNGPTYHCPFVSDGGVSPDIELKLDAQVVELMGSLAPVVRYGVLDYHVLTVKALVLRSDWYAQWLALVAQVLATGATMYFRDRAGHQMTVAFDPSQKLALERVNWNYEHEELKLIQILNQYQPSLVQGSALGIPAQASASVPAQKAVELAF